MQPRASQGDSGIDRQRALQEFGQHVAVHPGPQSLTLYGVAPFDAQDTDFKFHEGQRGYVEAGCIPAGDPRSDARVSPTVADLAQLGNHVRVEQEHQERSTFADSMPARGGSKSISAKPGMDNASARLRCCLASRR